MLMHIQQSHTHNHILSLHKFPNYLVHKITQLNKRQVEKGRNVSLEEREKIIVTLTLQIKVLH